MRSVILMMAASALLMTSSGCGDFEEKAESHPTATEDAGAAEDAAQDSQHAAQDRVDAQEVEDTSAPPADVGPIMERTRTFTHKMIKSSGENRFAALSYECDVCTFEQFLAIDPPEGWIKGPTQVLISEGGELRSRPSFEGVPDAMDFIAEVPGEEYELIAKTLDAEIVEIRAGGAIVKAQVMRDTLLTFATGDRVHELTDPEGGVYVLFAFEVDPLHVVVPDFQSPDVLSDFEPPDGWTYSTRVLEDELRLESSGVVTVLAVRAGTVSTWERR